MELAELKFVVDTKELETAATRISELGTAVSKLNKPMQDLTKESAKTNKELSKAEEAAAKAALAQVKLEQAQTKNTQAAAKSSSVLERQNLILEYMAQGNSKGQASILATAKAAGALDDEMLELNKTLVTQRTLIGGDPFDKSIGLMQKLQNEYKTTTEVTNLFNKNLGLTEKQMIDLAREKERLIALYSLEGKSLDNLTAEYDQLIQKSAMINKANDARTNSMKAQIKAQDDTAKANAYLASELDRVNRLTEAGGNITIATNNKLIKFEQALKQSGQTAAQQVVALEKYKASLLSIQKAGGNRQIDYLSRALGPQITDIAVGLATGQAPLTILLQQGGQLRDQFALAGVAGAEMGKMLVQASKAMVVSVKDIGLAVGQLFTGAIAGTGRAIANGISAPLTRFAEVREAQKQLDDGTISNIRYARLVEVANGRMTQSFLSMGKVGIFAVITLLATLAFKYVEVAKAEKELTKSLALSGAALGMSTSDAIAYANSMNSAGISTLDAMRIIGEFANTGSDASIPLKEIIKSAVDMEKYVGIATKDTVKAFSDISEKPVEGLIKLAKSTGNVSAATILQAEAFVKAGNNAEAARVAQIALKASNDEVAKRMINNLDPLQSLWLDIKSGISGAGQELYEFLKSSAVVNIFRTAWETVAVIVSEVWYVLKQTGIEISGIASQIKAVMSGDFSKAAEIGTQMKANAATARAEQDKLIASIMNRNKAEKETLSVTEQQRVANRKAAKEIEDRIKKENAPKTSKTDEEKERLKLLAESEKYLSRISSLNNQAIKEQEEYTKAQKLALDIFSDPDFKNYPEAQRIKIANAIELAHNEEVVAKRLEVQRKELEKLMQVQEKADDALFDSLDAEHALNMQILEQTDLLALQRSLIGATDAERKKALATKRLDLQLEKEIADINKRPISQAEKDRQIARATKRRLDAELNVNTEIADDFVEKQLAEYNRISDGLTDAVMTGLIEGGKAGRKKLRDLIVAELKKPITIVIKAIVDNLFGDLISSATGGKSGSSSGSGSNILSTLKSGYDLLTNGVSASIATSFGKLASTSFGQSIGLTTQVSGPVTASGQAATQFTPMGQNISAGLGIAGNALAGYGIQKSISNGYKTGESGIVDAITVAASAYFGPIAGVVAGVFNRAFGRKLVDQGVKGSFGGVEGFQGNNFTFEKGGWFRSDRERASALDPRTQSAFSMQFKSLQVQNALMADSLGQSSDAIANFTKDIRLSFKGLTEEQIAEKIQAEFTAINESLAQLALTTTTTRTGIFGLVTGTRTSWTDFVRDGETAAQALARLSTSLLTANSAIKHWGITLYDVSLAGGDAASTFIDLFGGLENFSRAMGFFYDNFFSEEEKLANLATDLTTSFAKLNLTLPSTREEFRQLVVSAKAAGDDTLVKNLTDLQYAFADLVPLTEELTETSNTYARSLIEAQRIAAGAGAYTSSDFYTPFATFDYSNSDLYSPALSSPIMMGSVNAMTSNTSLINAVNAVQEEIAELRYEVQADVIHNAKTATILTRVVPDGQSLNVTAAIDGGVV